MSGEMVCVHRAATVSEADIVTAWLEERGITAFVKNRLTAETLPIDTHVTRRGIEVCVGDDETAEKAKQLLAEHAEEVEAQHAPPVDDLLADTTCAECNAALSFPLASAGTTETCPHCGGYIDIPEL